MIVSPSGINLLLLTFPQGALVDERHHRFVRRLLVLPPGDGLRAEDRTGLPLQLRHQHRPQRHEVRSSSKTVFFLNQMVHSKCFNARFSFFLLKAVRRHRTELGANHLKERGSTTVCSRLR